MADIETYKIFQVNKVLISKYGYSQIMLKEYNDLMDRESWLISLTPKEYQVIRVSLFKPEETSLHEQRINDYLEYFKTANDDKDFKFLDIHICSDKYDKTLEKYDYINLEENHFVGKRVKNIFPELISCVKKSDNPDEVIKDTVNAMFQAVNERKKKLPLLQRYPLLFTYIIICLCVINFVIQKILTVKYDEASVLLLLGADYKTFTLGNHEFYRLFTYAFVHSGIAHLFCNMVSLYSIGKYIENRFGHYKFLLILFLSIIAGSLTQSILTDNQLCVGMSAGIYGLFTIFLIDVIKFKLIDWRKLIPTILLNLMLNFMSEVAWMSHLGGAIVGLSLYNALDEPKFNIKKYLLISVLILALLTKYILIDKINTFFGGTDLEYINVLGQLGFDTNKLTAKLFTIYEKYGGLK